MAFKLTYSDGQESDHGDDTVWTIDDGVLKMGREEGKWTVLLSPSHWAVVEVNVSTSRGDDRADDANEDADDDAAAHKDTNGDEDTDEKARDGDD